MENEVPVTPGRKPAHDCHYHPFLTRPISLDNVFFYVLRCTGLQAQTASFGEEPTIPNYKTRGRIAYDSCAGI